MKKSAALVLSSLLFVAFLSLGGCGGSSHSDVSEPQRPLATVTKKATHYEVVLDYEIGASPREMGRAYARALLKTIPEFENDLDTLIHSMLLNFSGEIPSFMMYAMLKQRVKDIFPQVFVDYREEIEGMADVLASAENGVPGDGRLSRVEIFMVNLMLDVARMEQCCAFSAFGSRSSTGRTQTFRVLEFPPSLSSGLTFFRRFAGVTHIKKGNRSLCLLQPLGSMGAQTAVNDDGLFATALDSPTRQPYVSQGKRSYPMDLRYAMENFSTLEEVAAYMKDSEHPYAYNHVIFMSDASVGKVLENNFSGVGPNMRRELRASASKLNEGIFWDEPECVFTVTSFVLKGNDSTYHWGHRGNRNAGRWETMRRFLSEIQGPLGPENMKKFMTYHEGDGDFLPAKRLPGDIYSAGAVQLIYLSHDPLRVEVAFLPPDDTPAKPIFELVPLSFGPGTR